ncbi:MAG TPA: glutaminyl-peptide cyclotransferase, partial [Ferruginibacter sp.]|nr:glutaminyl-peptide cyclotransferase [Ferruginibacter sp.]
KVEKSHNMGTEAIFGEGITILNGKIYQLTWENHLVYVYDINNIEKPIKTFQWASDGWGITNDGKRLIVSDGTASLYFVNPDDFRTTSSIRVIHDSRPIDKLNELEYIDGFIYANVYTKDVILKIDPANGHVVGQLDLSGLAQKYFPNQIITDRTDVLNGIAYDSTSKHLLITGKRWPKLFEVKLD